MESVPNNSRSIKVRRTKPVVRRKNITQTLTGHADVDNLLFTRLSPDSYSNTIVNRQTQKISNDQLFWKQRLAVRLGLYSDDPNLDYKSITKFLDNGKTFEENYQLALENNFDAIAKLLLENKKIYLDKPDGLLYDLYINVDQLGEWKNLPLEEFYQQIIEQHNQIAEHDDDKINRAYFNEKDYSGDTIIIAMPKFLSGPYEDNHIINIVLQNAKGFTNGELLYQIALYVPNDEEIRGFNDDVIKNNQEKILENLEKRRTFLIKEIENRPRSVFYPEILKELNEYYPYDLVKRMLNNPVIFRKYIIDHPVTIFNEFVETDVFGNHIFWAGLIYRHGEYILHLDS